MIERLVVKNFQGHVVSALDLHPGVNVITGSSRAGKSAIMRALLWLIHNRPSNAGEVFRHWDVPAKEEVAVEAHLDGHVLARRRKGTANVYEVDGETLRAIGTGVPTEVSSLLNIGPYSVQEQHRPYFLIEDSPGDVARRFNDVAGLDVIDEVQKTAGTLITRTRSEIEASETRKQDLETKLAGYEGLEGLEGDVERLERLEERAGDKRDSRARMARSLSQARTAHSEVADIDEFLEVVEGRVESLSTLLESLSEAEGKRERLNALLGRAKDAQAVVESCEWAVEVDGRVAGLATLAEDLEDKAASAARLRRLLEQGTSADKEVAGMEARISTHEQELEGALRDAGWCPFCEQPITAVEHEHRGG